MTSLVPSPEDSSGATPSDATSLAARRARLRSSLARRRISDELIAEAAPDAGDAAVPEEMTETAECAFQRSEEAETPEPAAMGVHEPPGFMPSQPLSATTDITALLASIDQTMTACAVNLVNLQKIASEQAAALKELGETFQNRNLPESGFDLDSLSESFSAALEPMKAVGVLVPAIDQLSHAMSEHIQREPKVNPDTLVTNLADQLASGAIDPWTFRCAYMAICPAEHPADLLRGLVELLGTQKLSGDLFRAAYEAVQSTERPESVEETIQPENQGQFDALQRANEELRRSLRDREKEFEQLLVDKDRELQEAQDQLNSRCEEFNHRYSEVSEALSKREEEYRALLENKDVVISDRESELNLLRSQMEELRSQTQEMVTDLQKQIVNVPAKPEPPTPAPSPKTHVAPGFFDATRTGESKSFFDNTAAQRAQSKPQGTGQPSSVTARPPAGPITTQAPQTPAQPGAGGTHTFSAASGRHGAGVRAQVFEVIVRQALAGAPWREICAGPMQVNNITPEEVEAEVKRRQQK